jgi:trans-aconitate methyltransferase
MSEQVQDHIRVTPAWLGAREAADAAARAPQLVAQVRRRLAGATDLVVHDLGCGTGSMGRWLAPQLPRQQRWVMHDRDRDLLDEAARGISAPVEVRHGDITSLTAEDLRGASLVTASALLDLLTADEVERLVEACVGAGCPVLLTISVAGRVEITPADPLDAEIAAAFNAHQRRTVAGRRLLGPDAVDVMVEAFARRGVPTVVLPSPWRLEANEVDLISEWFVGWLEAACEQRPELAEPVAEYALRRLADLAEGRLAVVVHHYDLLANCE